MPHSFWLNLILSLRVWQHNKLFIFSGSFRTYCENSFEQKVKCPIWKKLLHKKTITGVLTISRYKPYSKFAFIFVSVRLYVQHSGQFCAEMCKKPFPLLRFARMKLLELLRVLKSVTFCLRVRPIKKLHLWCIGKFWFSLRMV